MGAYAAISRIQSTAMDAEPTVHDGEALCTPSDVLDPWTQVVRARADLAALPAPRRASIERILAELTDDELP